MKMPSVWQDQRESTSKKTGVGTCRSTAQIAMAGNSGYSGGISFVLATRKVITTFRVSWSGDDDDEINQRVS